MLGGMLHGMLRGWHRLREKFVWHEARYVMSIASIDRVSLFLFGRIGRSIVGRYNLPALSAGGIVEMIG